MKLIAKLIKNCLSSAFVPTKLSLCDIKKENHDLYFYVKDYGQVKPYKLNATQIQSKSIISNLHSYDAFLVGHILNLFFETKARYNKVIHDTQGNFVLKTNETNEELTFNFSELIDKPYILNFCDADVLHELIIEAYKLGRESSINHAKMLTNYLKDNNKTNPLPSNIIKLVNKR